MKVSSLSDTIYHIFFGEEFHHHENNITRILSSSSFDKLLQVYQTLQQEDKNYIFDSCIQKNVASSRFSTRDCQNIFMRMRAVDHNADFI
jgi:hypothetical protein